MTTNITLAATNSIFDHWKGKSFDCSIEYVGGDMHEIFIPAENKTLLFDIKSCVIQNAVQLHGILQEGSNVGRVVIQLD